MKRIGIVGCGAIGSSLALWLNSKRKRNASLSALFDLDAAKAVKLANSLKGSKKLIVSNLDELIRRSDIVIECASARCSFEVASAALLKSRTVLVMSVGGIIDKIEYLRRLAISGGGRLVVPSGAISGVDALKAAKVAGVKQVVLTTIKHPRAFDAVEYVRKNHPDLKKISKDRLLFSGSASEAVRYFPQNINVAAVLSLAGIGKNKTRVKIIASPQARSNIHEISIISQAAEIKTRTVNVVHPDNPKTSYLAFLSALAALNDILEPVTIGT